MKNNILQEISKIHSIMGIKTQINEAFSVGRIFSNLADIADELILKDVQNTEKLTDLADIAAGKEGKTKEQWLSEIRNSTKKDWEDWMENTGKFKSIFTNSHNAILYITQNSSKAADDVMSWMERTDISSFDKEEMRDLLVAIRTGKGWSKESSGYKAFKERGKMPDNIKHINTKSTKIQTKYFSDIAHEELFRSWINKFEGGKWAREYDIDYFMPGVTKSDWPGLEKALKNEYIKSFWVDAAFQLGLKQKGEGVWKLPDWEKGGITVYKPSEGWSKWFTSWPTPLKWSVGLGIPLMGAVGTAPIWVPWLFGEIGEATVETAKAAYEKIQIEMDEVLRKLEDETRNGPLVRNIFNETVTFATLNTKYQRTDGTPIPWDSYTISSEEAKKIAENLLLPNFPKPDNKEMPEFSAGLINAIRSRIYGMVPDGLALIKVVEEFKKLTNKNPRDYYFDNLTDILTFADDKELSENSYIDMTDPPSGEGMVLTIYLPAAILAITDPQLAYNVDTLNKIRNKELKVGVPKLDENEMLNTKKKADLFIDLNNWVVKPTKDSERYKGSELKSFSDWKESCSAVVGTEDKLKKVFNETMIKYLENEVRQRVKFEDIFKTDKIVSYFNNNFPCKDFKGRLDVKDPEMVMKIKAESSDFTPQPVSPKQETPTNTGGNTGGGGGKGGPKIGETKTEYGTDGEPITFTWDGTKWVKTVKESKEVIGLAKLLMEQSVKKKGDWKTGLFQDFMNKIEPGGWWFSGTTPTTKITIERDNQNDIWNNLFDKPTSDIKKQKENEGVFSKSPTELVEKTVLPYGAEHIQFQLAQGQNFKTVTDKTYAPYVLTALNQYPEIDYLVGYYMGIAEAIGNSIFKVRLSNVAEKAIRDNLDTIKNYLAR